LILKRKTNINLAELKEQSHSFLSISSNVNPIETYSQWIELQQVYNAAISEISTKLEIFDDEFQIHYTHNPIHHMECRLKSIQSIARKLDKLNFNNNIQAVKENVLDIAGIRVVCNYIDDIYNIEDLLLGQDDVKLITRKDYIKNPKSSGYRSLHLIVSVPVHLSKRTEVVPVEIQLRTIPMDYWASLEHKLQYKAKSTETESYRKQLIECAAKLAEIEKTMKSIHLDIEPQEDA